MSFKVIKKGPGLSAIIDRLKTLNKSSAEAGLYSKGKGMDYDENLALRMALHEKGNVSTHLPARPVFGTTVSDRGKEIEDEAGELMKKYLAGKISEKEMLDKIGTKMETSLKEQFTRRRFAPLSPNYKVRPSGARVTSASIPLLDTKKMRDSITHKVHVR